MGGSEKSDISENGDVQVGEVKYGTKRERERGGGDDGGVRVIQLALKAGWLAQVCSEAKFRQLLSSPIFLLCPFLSNSHLCTLCSM